MTETLNKPNRQNAAPAKKKKRSGSDFWRRFKRNRSAVLGMIILCVIVTLVICADLFYSYDDVAIKMNVSQRLIPPFSQGHILGTDDLGRDLAARILHGGRRSLVISFSSVAFALVVGSIIGAVSGYYGGVLDNVIMRIIDILMAIPMTMLAIVIVAALGPSQFNMILALSIAQVPTFARVMRGQVLTVRNTEYIEAARAIGTKDAAIIAEHIVPNVLSPIIVQIAIRAAAAIINTATLSFLGLGISAPTPEWGAMLSAGRNYIRDYSYLTFIPGLAMMLTILSLNLLGDGLRDTLDPRLR
ncbi:MAG: ABC transporter permease [Eubacteriales bacterium]|nr:ABC transporter permease [Eubacteriales bacterium]MCI6979100.1 ABC transporter permease [Clostridiales bacterium]MDD6722075.1 ABC transporter permease [Clostridiales bacterium]